MSAAAPANRRNAIPRPAGRVGESKLISWIYRGVRRAGELVLIFIDRWYRLGSEPATRPGSLWTGNDRARIGDGHPARRSGDPVALARNLAHATRRTVALAPRLLCPVPESSAVHDDPRRQGARDADGDRRAAIAL